MITLHDTRPCTPYGHSAYRGYDASIGKLASLSPTGRVHRCPACEKRFATAAARDQHCRDRHTGEAA